MIDVVHDRGVHACGQTAFRTVDRPRHGTPVVRTDIRLLDGSVPVPDALMICGSCRDLIDLGDVTPRDGYAV